MLRIFNIIFISIFLLILFIPLFFLDLENDRVSVQENRMLAKYPLLSDIRSNPITFIHDFESWLKDSTGFREFSLFLYNFVEKNKKLSGFWYKDGQYIILIGDHGHHYFADYNGFLISKFQGKQFLTNHQLESLAYKLEEIRKYLDTKCIPLVVMLRADKETVYPEFYPKSIKKGPEPVQLDIITDYIKTNTNVNIFNIKQALLKEKNNYLLYHLVDTSDFTKDYAHYNEIGAFFAYRELMNYINIYYPELIPYEFSDLSINYDEKSIPEVSLKVENTYKKLDPSDIDEFLISLDVPWAQEIYQNQNQNLPVALILRDSYASEAYIGKYIAQHFGKVIMVHYNSIEHFEYFVGLYKPDIVILESAERSLINFADKIVKIPKLSF